MDMGSVLSPMVLAGNIFAMDSNTRPEESRATHCSFCGRCSRDVGPMVEGPHEVYVCTKCVTMAFTVLRWRRYRPALAGPYSIWAAGISLLLCIGLIYWVQWTPFVVTAGRLSIAFGVLIAFVIGVAIPKEFQSRRIIRWWQQSIQPICPSCGYDLRASKERCPECGTAVPREAAK